MYCMYKAKQKKKKWSEAQFHFCATEKIQIEYIHCCIKHHLFYFFCICKIQHTKDQGKEKWFKKKKKIKSTKLNKKKNTRAGKFSNSNVCFRWIVKKMKWMQIESIFTWPVTTTLLHYFLQLYKSKKLPAVVLEDEKVTNMIP